MSQISRSRFPTSAAPPSLLPSLRQCLGSVPNVSSSLSLSRCRGFGRITEAPRHAHRSTMIVRKGGSLTLAAAVILIAGVSQSGSDRVAFSIRFTRPTPRARKWLHPMENRLQPATFTLGLGNSYFRFLHIPFSQKNKCWWRGITHK